MTIRIETLQRDDWLVAAHLIFSSTNTWYRQNRNQEIFCCEPSSIQLFCEVYESLDPGCCLIARCLSSNQIVGSCFFHVRPTHVSLGIMNVHPKEFGRGIAKALVGEIVKIAERRNLPVRLVSSAMNLDSYSLYTRAGFVPRQLYQDFQLNVPTDGIRALEANHQVHPAIREAELADVSAMGDLEQRVSGIRRDQDYAYFIENKMGIWHCSVSEGRSGLNGWIVSIDHPATSMIGPCVARDAATAKELLKSELDYRKGAQLVFLVPADCDELVRTVYGWGAKNCELHVLQVRGPFNPFQGISMPTFMPETA
jgi:GNAT superfamily N-acetyltransferase